MSHLPAHPSATEKDETSSTRFRHSTKDDLLLFRSYGSKLTDEVERAMLDKRPLCLQLDSYESNRDFVIACLYYALDQGVKVIVTSSDIEKRRERESAI